MSVCASRPYRSPNAFGYAEYGSFTALEYTACVRRRREEPEDAAATSRGPVALSHRPTTVTSRPAAIAGSGAPRKPTCLCSSILPTLGSRIALTSSQSVRTCTAIVLPGPHWPSSLEPGVMGTSARRDRAKPSASASRTKTDVAFAGAPVICVWLCVSCGGGSATAEKLVTFSASRSKPW